MLSSNTEEEPSNLFLLKDDVLIKSIKTHVHVRGNYIYY